MDVVALAIARQPAGLLIVYTLARSSMISGSFDAARRPLLNAWVGAVRFGALDAAKAVLAASNKVHPRFILKILES
jgi:hypothetical protein